MKMPNGYGSVVKLKGTRRKPWAVRVSYLEEQPDGKVKRKQKYLSYFVNQSSAITFLSEYNGGLVVPEHQKYADVLTFEELYGKWEKYRKGLKSNPAESTWRNYKIAYNFFEPIHGMKITAIKAQDLQDILNSKNNKSKGTIGSMRAILKGMWSYAVNNDYLEKDITTNLVFEWEDPDSPIHTRFTDKEIEQLWEALWTINNVDIILIYIYTGLRPTELLEIRSEDVHLAEGYMTGGIKTEAGKNRIIPIHDKIKPLIEKRLDQKRDYLITNKYGNQYTYKVYHSSNFCTLMNILGWNHSPHDMRYTFASLADNAGMNPIAKKIILGHAISNKEGTAFKIGKSGDVTSNVYTEKTIEELKKEVNKIPCAYPG